MANPEFVLSTVVVGLLLAFVGIWLTVSYARKQSRDTPKKILAMDYSILKSYRIDGMSNPFNVKMIVGDNKSDTYGSIHIVRFIIGNKGNTTISKDDITRKASLLFGFPDLKIIKVYSKDNVHKPGIVILQKEDSNSRFDICFERIESGAATKFEMLFGTSVAQEDLVMNIDVDIKDQPKDRSNKVEEFPASSVMSRQTERNSLYKLLLAVVALLISIVLTIYLAQQGSELWLSLSLSIDAIIVMLSATMLFDYAGLRAVSKSGFSGMDLSGESGLGFGGDYDNASVGRFLLESLKDD